MKLVKDLMHTPAYSIGPNDTLRHALRIMNDHHFRQLPVAEDGKLLGILTDRDIRLHVVYLEDRAESGDSFNVALEAPVDGVMTRDVQVLHPAQTLDDALNLFITEKYGGMPVVNGGGELVGILTYIDLLHEFRRQLNGSGHKTS